MNTDNDQELNSILFYLEEIWERMRIIDKVFSNTYAESTPYIVQYEMLMIQFRKILEGIAFIGVINHKNQIDQRFNSGAKNNINKQSKKAKKYDVSKWWRAKEILDIVSEFNPNFYPQAVELTEDKKILPCDEPYLTKDDFVSLYDKASGYLHETNLFSKKVKYSLTNSEAMDYAIKIARLMKSHRLMLSNRDMFIIQVRANNVKSQAISIYRFTPVKS